MAVEAFVGVGTNPTCLVAVAAENVVGSACYILQELCTEYF